MVWSIHYYYSFPLKQLNTSQAKNNNKKESCSLNMVLPQNTQKIKKNWSPTRRKKKKKNHSSCTKPSKEWTNMEWILRHLILKIISSQYQHSLPSPCLLSHSLSLTIISMCKGANKEVKYREHQDSKKEKLQFDNPFDASKNNNQ